MGFVSSPMSDEARRNAWVNTSDFQTLVICERYFHSWMKTKESKHWMENPQEHKMAAEFVPLQNIIQTLSNFMQTLSTHQVLHPDTLCLAMDRWPWCPV